VRFRVPSEICLRRLCREREGEEAKQIGEGTLNRTVKLEPRRGEKAIVHFFSSPPKKE